MLRCLLFGVLKKHWSHIFYFQKYGLSNFKIQFTKNVESVTTVVFPLYSSIVKSEKKIGGRKRKREGEREGEIGRESERDRSGDSQGI